MISKWEPGTRVRVVLPDEPELDGWMGTVEKANYAQVMEATSVVLDKDEYQLGAFFYDYELEEAK